MKTLDGLKSFFRDYLKALDRDDKKSDKKAAKWILKYPWQTFVIVLVVYLFALLGLYAIINPAPVPPAQPVMTIWGFFNWLSVLQLPAAFWVVIFILLWLTKWH